MIASLRAEWLKLSTTLAYYGLTVSAAVLTAFIGFGLIAQEPPPWNLTTEELGALGGTTAITLGLFCLMLGLRSFTEEFRYGTIVHTVVSDPRHTRTSVAKAVVGAVGGAGLSAVSTLLTGLVLVVMANASGGSLPASKATVLVIGLVVGGAMWAVLGVGLGAIIRQPVPATVVALLWVLVIENVAGFFIGPVARYLPGRTAQVLAGGIGRPSDVALAAGVMVAWAVALSVIGWMTLRRRDLM